MKSSRTTLTCENRKGFTLLEAIIASSILSIAMLGLLPLLISSYHVDTQTSYRVRAQFMGTQRLDDLISRDTLTCDGTANTDYIDARTGQVYNAAPAVPVVMMRTWTVGAPAAPSNLCPITVTTAYTDAGGPKTFAVSSQKGR